MGIPRNEQRSLLLQVARRAMIERGLEPEIPAAALAEAAALDGTPLVLRPGTQDLRGLLWCSIDNDDSRDLDQLTVAENLGKGRARIQIAVADVSSSVLPGSAADTHAQHNTTTVYTPPQIFPMLPLRLSTDLTSLNPGEDRLAYVISMAVDAEGLVSEVDVRRAAVRNLAKLAYPGVGAWLEGGEMPAAVRAVPGLAENLRLQDDVAQRLRGWRHENGALELETVDVRAIMEDDAVTALLEERRNRARDLIEDFMIAANSGMARFLEGRGLPVIRRVLRSPERWQRIVALALAEGGKLPPQPDAKALNAFLIQRRAADPDGFPDLSLAVIKLLGRGEYAVRFPGKEASGHFGLAVTEYTHSTAPNRRYPDLITQRLLHAALARDPMPYRPDELVALAAHCTKREDDAQKIERLVRKSAAALLLSDQIGREFPAIVTGATPKGTWVRINVPPVEGRLEHGAEGLDVGDRLTVKLVSTDVERGFIDFVRADHAPPAQSRR
jgi:exoribonuclease-2